MLIISSMSSPYKRLFKVFFLRNKQRCREVHREIIRCIFSRLPTLCGGAVLVSTRAGRLLVLIKVALEREALLAACALILLIGKVRLQVRAQVGTVRERLATGLAVVGLLTSV